MLQFPSSNERGGQPNRHATRPSPTDMSTIYRGDDPRYEYDRTTFAHQLKTLAGWGFRAERLNVEALRRSNGNVTKALDLLSSGAVSEPAARPSTTPAAAARPAPQTSVVPAQYAAAEGKMRDMGFSDSVKNVEALQRNGNDVQRAVDDLLGASSRPSAATVPRPSPSKVANTSTMPRPSELAGKNFYLRANFLDASGQRHPSQLGPPQFTPSQEPSQQSPFVQPSSFTQPPLFAQSPFTQQSQQPQQPQFAQQTQQSQFPQQQQQSQYAQQQPQLSQQQQFAQQQQPQFSQQQQPQFSQQQFSQQQPPQFIQPQFSHQQPQFSQQYQQAFTQAPQTSQFAAVGQYASPVLTGMPVQTYSTLSQPAQTVQMQPVIQQPIIQQPPVILQPVQQTAMYGQVQQPILYQQTPVQFQQYGYPQQQLYQGFQ